MDNGYIKLTGDTDHVINKYLSHASNSCLRQFFESPELAPGNDKVKMKRIEVLPIFTNNAEPITINTAINVEFDFWNYTEDIPINLSLHLFTVNSECVFNVGTSSLLLSKGLNKSICKIPATS